MPLPRWALFTIAGVLVFRVVLAAHIPLNEDEAYYWVWSLHPAFGYTDHPPMVGWLSIASSWLGTSSLAVRLPFIICEAVAAFAVGRAAILASGDPRAGAAAAMIVTFIPQPRWMLGEALPDAPYVCFWALALWAVAYASATNVADRASRGPIPLIGDPGVADRASRGPTGGAYGAWPVLLGLALGGALLSRMFSIALLAGVAAFAFTPAGRPLQRGIAISIAIGIALYLPDIVWNATHHWENFAFTFVTRQPVGAFSLHRWQVMTNARFLAWAGCFIPLTSYLAVRRREFLLALTALPLALLLLALSFFQTVESYWLLGPLVSQSVDLGIVYVEWRIGWRILWAAVGGLAALVATATWLNSSVFAYRALADDVRREQLRSGAAIMTDRLEIAGELVYNRVWSVIIIGNIPQRPEWDRWYDAQLSVPQRVLLVTYQPLADQSALSASVHRAFSRVKSLGDRGFTVAGAPARTFSYTECDDPHPDAAAALFPWL